MTLARLRRQDGFVREVVWYLALIVIVAVVIFDVVAVTKAHLGVRQNAIDAADEAVSVYIQTGNPGMAQDSATVLLKEHGSVMIPGSFKLVPSAQGRDQATVTVGARRSTPTYVFRYFERIPWGVGDWFHKELNPASIETNAST